MAGRPNKAANPLTEEDGGGGRRRRAQCGGCARPLLSDLPAEMAGAGEPWYKISSEVYYNPKKSPQDEELPDFDFGLPQYKFDPNFNGVERLVDKCICLLDPARCVCSDGFDTGRRFLGCQHEDFRACQYVEWVDKPWEGRARTVIGELASKNLILENLINEKEAEKVAEKERHKMEKKLISRMNKERLNCRDRMLMFAIFIIIGMFAVLFEVAKK